MLVADVAGSVLIVAGLAGGRTWLAVAGGVLVALVAPALFLRAMLPGRARGRAADAGLSGPVDTGLIGPAGVDTGLGGPTDADTLPGMPRDD